MKLNKSIQNNTEFYSEEDLLRFENEFLKDELKFQEDLRSLELMETVLDCIQQEGSVSKSLKIMFGDSVEDMNYFKDELQKAYEALNIKEIFNKTLEFDKLKRLLELVTARATELVTYVDNNKSKINFPIEANISWKTDYLIEYAHKFANLVSKLRNVPLDQQIDPYSKEVGVKYPMYEGEFDDITISIKTASTKWKPATLPSDNIVKLNYDDIKTGPGAFATKVKPLFNDIIKTAEDTMHKFELHVKEYADPASISSYAYNRAIANITKFKRFLMFTLRADLYHVLKMINVIFTVIRTEVNSSNSSQERM